MAKIELVEKLIATLRERAAKARRDGDVSVAVGFSANYALWVHENIEAHHDVGQAKFLEEPARTQQDEMRSIVVNGVKRGLTLAQSLVLAGLHLQREAQLRCPVLNGLLKSSAFTRLEGPDGGDKTE